MSEPVTPIRWGILGTARIAARVGRAIHRAAGAELAGIASRTAERAAAWAAEHGAARVYGSYDALLDAPEIDAVYIPLPPSLHREWTIRAAERGKHVLCEKPLALDAAEADEMAAACRERSVQLMDGVMWLHHPRTAAMHRPIHDGTLGDVRRVTSAFTFPIERLPAGDHRFRREMGGGSLLDLGWYCVGAALWAFDVPPRRVFGMAQQRGDVDVGFSGLLWFDGGRMASFDCGFGLTDRRWLEVAGAAGSLVCDDFTRPWNEEKSRFWQHALHGQATEHRSAVATQEVCMIEQFGAIVRRGTPDDCWPRAAVATQRVCDALRDSAQCGCPIDLCD